MDFLIGCDPELFVRDRDGKLISAFGMIPGTKANPHRVEGGAVQVDGMALEFNIDPAKNFKEFNDNITSVLSQLQTMIPQGYTFDFSPVAEFGNEYIDAQPEAAKELGCDPDFNVYTGRVNPKPDLSLGIRTASGHIHVGWTEGRDVENPEHIDACIMMTRQLDHTIGLASLVWDRNTTRRRMYGKFGTYRPKPYGVEYRTLSNAWVSGLETRQLVYLMAVKAAQGLADGTRLYELGYRTEDAISWHDEHHWANTYSCVLGNIPHNFITKQQKEKLRAIYDGFAVENPFDVKPSETMKSRKKFDSFKWSQALLPPVALAGNVAGQAAAQQIAILDDVVDDVEEFIGFDPEE